MSVAVHVIVRGRVQGVGYRAWTEHQALRRGLAGWVRNRRDGSVEAVFSGPPEVVTIMVQSLWKGPPASQVDAVDQREADTAERALTRSGERFSVLTTV